MLLKVVSLPVWQQSMSVLYAEKWGTELVELYLSEPFVA